MRLCTLSIAGILTLIAVAPLTAGPPLLCPELVLTEGEFETLDALDYRHGDASLKVGALVDLLADSKVARFRIEAIRWAFTQRSRDFGALQEALTARLDRLGKGTTDQDRYDHALATIIDDWSSEDARRAVCLLSEIADETGDPVRLFIAAEAHDLVANEQGPEVLAVASQLSLAHCRRAWSMVKDATEGEAYQAAQLVRKHLPYMKGMHSGDQGWGRFLAQVPALAGS